MNSMTYVLSADNIDICVLIDCGDFYTLNSYQFDGLI